MTARTIDVWFYGDDTGRRVPVTAHDTPVAGLVVNEVPERPGLWAVTHEASGTAVLTLPGPHAALGAAITLGLVADWTLPGSLLRDLPGLGRSVRKLARELGCYQVTFSVRAVSDDELAATESGVTS